MSNSGVEPSTSDCVDYRTRNGDFHLDDDRLKSFSNQQFIELLKERQFYVSKLEDDLKKSQGMFSHFIFTQFSCRHPREL